MGVYDRPIAQALRMIAAKGEAVTWTELPDGAPLDSAQPWRPEDGTAVPHTVAMLFLPPGGSAAFLAYLIGTEVPRGGALGYMGQVAFAPSLKSRVTRTDGTILKPTKIDVLAPNGTPLFYTVALSQ